jgi:ubiquinone/menaquinone biosynthesis C-methylase UbiE
MTDHNDPARLKTEYAHRTVRLAGSDRYSSSNRAYLFTIQQRQRAVIDLLRHCGLQSFAGRRLLEVGCGRGSVLYDLMWHELRPHQLHGLDLLPERLQEALARFPGLPLVCGDGQYLPYKSGSFDMVLQYTVFSSILDAQIKASLAHEMLRVVRKPGGLILWYDFWLNPTNPHTRGIGKPEIKGLFPGCQFTFRRITLAPPLTRKLVPLSWTLSVALEKLWFLNTHYLVAITPA